jgi:SAM-dependent methyltransferase
VCSHWDIEIVAGALPEREVRGKRVLEVGSIDVNGSVRPQIEALGPAEYVGIDMRPGRGVDIICDAAVMDQRFGADAFDVVISTELLEHAREWQKIVHNFKYVLRPGGLLVVTTRSYGVDFHRHPYDYWRYEKDDFELIFGDMEVQDLQLDPTDPGIFVKARKPLGFVERDLSAHCLYSILRRKKKREATRFDVVHFETRYRFIRLLMDLLPKRYRRAVHEGLLR